MPITIDLTEAELAQLREVTHQDDPTENVRTAVREFLRSVQRQRLVELSNQVEMDDNWRDLESAELSSQNGRDESGSD